MLSASFARVCVFLICNLFHQVPDGDQQQFGDLVEEQVIQEPASEMVIQTPEINVIDHQLGGEELTELTQNIVICGGDFLMVAWTWWLLSFLSQKKSVWQRSWLQKFNNNLF